MRERYREMVDAAYLSEEAGRRKTGRRLLDLVARYVPSGSFLDVGSGHGLLLDEARERGYEAVGIEPSAASAAYAREVFGAGVAETPLEEFAGDDEFDVIVLADVLEHLDDPCAALDRCLELLAPGGVLCVVSPDPSSLTARLFRGRWWGYLPGHTCMLPRRTLLELLAARGLVVSTDVPFVRTFSLRYWVSGLAERTGPLGALVRALARPLPAFLTLSLSTGDQRVVLAHKVEVAGAERPLVRDRGARDKVYVVLPAYNAAATIPQVADDLPREAADRALLVDDASQDDTLAVALRKGFDVIRHPANRGYGANQKTCYVRAILDGAAVVVMVHADNQYDPALVPAMVEPILAGEADVVIGSRLLEDETIAGGMPRWKWLGNRLLTWIENRAFERDFSEYHTGYRAFSADALRSIAFLRNSDGFVFDQEIFAQVIVSGARVLELPIPTRYFKEASSVSFWASVEYGLRTLLVLTRFRLDRRRAAWPLLRPPAAEFRPAERTAVHHRSA